MPATNAASPLAAVPMTMAQVSARRRRRTCDSAALMAFLIQSSCGVALLSIDPMRPPGMSWFELRVAAFSAPPASASGGEAEHAANIALFRHHLECIDQVGGQRPAAPGSEIHEDPARFRLRYDLMIGFAHEQIPARGHALVEPRNPGVRTQALALEGRPEILDEVGPDHPARTQLEVTRHCRAGRG